jgi:hypothetical protein
MDLQSLKASIFAFVDANFLRTIAASAFGTFAGAWIASRAQAKKAIVTELNAVATAHLLATQIANVYMALKRQMIRPIHEAYIQISRDYEAYEKSRAAGGAQVAFSYSVELRTLSPPRAPIDSLEKLVIEKISIRGRGLAAAAELASAIYDFEKIMNDRANLIEEFRSGQNKTERQKLEMFLGLRTSAGVIDDRFRSNMEALFLKTNDCIFFAYILSNDLHKYSNRLYKRFRWRFRLARLKQDSTNWSFAISTGLLPKDADYQDWLRGFQQAPSRWRKFATWIRERRTAGKMG